MCLVRTERSMHQTSSFEISTMIFHCMFCLTDMIRRRSLRTRAIKLLVLDEADEMLNKGFKEQIYDVYRYLPPATQVTDMLFCNLRYTACMNEVSIFFFYPYKF